MSAILNLKHFKEKQTMFVGIIHSMKPVNVLRLRNRVWRLLQKLIDVQQSENVVLKLR